MNPSNLLERTILHVDMDAFFASVEQRDDPSLRGRPVVVGGPSRRGVVCAASYEARPFGVRSAMPMAEALRRCPQAVVVPARHGRYAEVSDRVFDVFHRYTPLVEGLSLDEAFLDVTASRELFGEGATIARRIKADIREETGLTASAGVANCKLAAKIASDLQKPDGLVVVPSDVAAFLAPLAIDRMWGVGPRAAARLRSLGLSTIGQLAAARVAQLCRVLGPSWGARAGELSRGVDDRPVRPDREARSIGAEETFDDDLVGRDALAAHLLAQSCRVARRLLRSGLSGRVVILKVKFHDFSVITRRVTVPEPVADTDSIYRTALELLDRAAIEPSTTLRGLFGRRVRLTGVAVAELVRGEQPMLFPDRKARRRLDLERVVSDVAHRYGDGALVRATLLGKGRAG